MSRMADQQAQDDDRRNDSGMDDYLAWVDWMERNDKRIIEETENDSRKEQV